MLQLQCKFGFLFFSLALDGSTDTQNNQQPAIFVSSALSDFTIKEKLLDLAIMRKITRGIDIQNALEKALTRTNVPPNNSSVLQLMAHQEWRVKPLVNWNYEV